MWLQICQGLLVLGFLGRFLGALVRALSGQKRIEASGAVGVLVSVFWFALAGVILWRAGGVSTIIPPP